MKGESYDSCVKEEQKTNYVTLSTVNNIVNLNYIEMLKMVENTFRKMEKQNTIVLDLTYFCNSSCNYCRWGNYTTEGRKTLDFESLLIPKKTLEVLKTERLVFSGGEPRLHPKFMEILTYYSDLVDEIILITNGYGLDLNEAKSLINYGLTGFTFSLDSLDPVEEKKNRKTSLNLFEKIIKTIQSLSDGNREYELGINSVITHANANWNTVKNLLCFADRHSLDFVKFSPVFDDGYVGKNAPDLMLRVEDSINLREIGKNIPNHHYKYTNGESFWYDIAAIASRETLNGSSCGLGLHKANAINGVLTMCYWMDRATYGLLTEILNSTLVTKVYTSLENDKSNCSVDFHCFCNQKVRHKWR